MSRQAEQGQPVTEDTTGGAEFVHLWHVTGGKVSWLHQYTDTARWHEVL